MNQDHFKIGPLIYAKDYFETDPEANYYWAGQPPPVRYSKSGVPIDKNGTDCLDLKCPFHPSWSPKKDQIEFNSFLEFSIPKYQYYQIWLRDNSLDCSNDQAKRFLFKWILSKTWGTGFRRIIRQPLKKVLLEVGSVNELIKKVYEYEQTNTDN